MSPPSLASPVEVFVSYSHKDAQLREKLLTHLALLQNQKVISAWYDGKIDPGKEWEPEIYEHLNAARIILLLISADFLASSFCYSKEMTRALERHNLGDARVIPIILRPVDWHSASFGKLKALPTDGKAVTEWTNRDSAWKTVATGIRTAAEGLRAHP